MRSDTGVLVDGPKLAVLMLDHGVGVGVNVRHIQIPKIDSEEGKA